jgi:hypothetical protein
LVAVGKHVNDIRAIARQLPIITTEKLLEVVFFVKTAPRLYSENRKLAEFSLVVGYSPDSNDVRAEAEESSLLRAVTRNRLVKAERQDLACCDL